jgi:hypothetical protein
MGRLNESVHVTYLPAEERDAQVSVLHDPWIGDEGPLEAGFRRGSGGGPLRPRGFAFDQRTTVVWDEAGVQVLRPSEPTPEVTALESPVVLRHWYTGPARLIRIDYMERGCLVGSRYTASDEEDRQQGERDA